MGTNVPFRLGLHSWPRPLNSTTSPRIGTIARRKCRIPIQPPEPSFDNPADRNRRALPPPQGPASQATARCRRENRRAAPGVPGGPRGRRPHTCSSKPQGPIAVPNRVAGWSQDLRGAILPGRHISNHTLRHSYARDLLVHGIPINYLSRWLGHSSIQTTLIYLELVPDPAGSLATVP